MWHSPRQVTDSRDNTSPSTRGRGECGQKLALDSEPMAPLGHVFIETLLITLTAGFSLSVVQFLFVPEND